MARTVTFNGVDLGALSADIIISDIKSNSAPTRRLNQAELGETDGGVLTNAFYSTRDIVISGYIGSTDANTAEAVRDTLLANVQTNNGVLKFEQAGTTRVYTGTLADAMFSDDNMGGMIPFDLKFVCTDPFGYEENQIETLEAGVTTMPDTTAITNNGSYRVYPIIIIHIQAVSASTVSNLRVAIGSNTISVSRTWAAGERLYINGLDKTVKIGSTQVPYSGMFPYLEVGANTLTTYDTFSTRTINKTIQFTERYL